MNETNPKLISELESQPRQNSEHASSDINEVYNEAIDDFYEKQHKEHDRVEELRNSILQETKNRSSDSAVERPAQATFTVPKESPKVSGVKKALTVLGIAMAGLLPAKKAAGQEKIQGDKEGIKKEVVLPSKNFELDSSTKAEWGEYRTWYWNYVKEHHVDTALLQTRAGADHMMNEYKEQTGKVITAETIKRVQHFFIGYRDLMQEAAKKGKIAIEGNGDTFMEGISKEDGIGGIHTLKYGAPEDIERIELQERMKGPDVNGGHSEYVLNTNKNVLDAGYVDTSKYDKTSAN